MKFVLTLDHYDLYNKAKHVLQQVKQNKTILRKFL
jgi:hypothetical protein